MSPFHFLRSFKSLAGVTPKRYVDEIRLKRLACASNQCAIVIPCHRRWGIERKRALIDRERALANPAH